jgi:L-asparaginase
MRMKIAVLGTGGAIAGVAVATDDKAEPPAVQPNVDGLLRSISIPGGRDLVCEQVAQIDSRNMDFEVWRRLALRCEHWLAQDNIAGVVITHGTDTLEETSYFLHRALRCSSKPVVLTCAIRPVTSLSPDGPQNLSDAFVVTATPGARGVMVVCGGAIHSALDVVKQHTSSLNAFSSGDAGPIGYVENNEVRLVREWPNPPSDAAIAFSRWTQATRWPRVEIVMNHAGNDGGIVRALIREGALGIVAAGTGNGTLHRGLEEALLYAVEGGLKVVRSSRCPFGRVLAHPDEMLLGSGGLAPAKARIELMLNLLDG